jgi:endonuclease III
MNDPAKTKRARKLGKLLEAAYPQADCALVHRNAFELLVATILSAQCTDLRVNQVTPVLFARFPDARALAIAPRDALEQIIRPTGFFRAKSANLLGMAKALVAHHGGEVPRSLDELVKLPGVGRKTANVVLGTAYGIPSGVVVDTHVRRLSKRMGMTVEDDPVRIEHDLMSLFPKKCWIALSHRLIHHGRSICVARSPRCGICTLAKECPRIGVLEA